MIYLHKWYHLFCIILSRVLSNTTIRPLQAYSPTFIFDIR
nr:MAG TPA: hypothetical protein [Inoviridae sp.]